MNVAFAFSILCFFMTINVYAKQSQNGEEDELFRRLFVQRRKEHIDAVKRIRELTGEESQKKIVLMTAEKIFSMLRNDRAVLENNGFVPGISSFPKDEDVRDALSNILENTFLIGDIILTLPDISEIMFSSHNEWTVLLKWSLQFSNETKLLNQEAFNFLQLVCQEMNFTARMDDYINPYRKSFKLKRDLLRSAEEPSPKRKKKVKEKIRGPRMSFGEL